MMLDEQVRAYLARYPLGQGVESIAHAVMPIDVHGVAGRRQFRDRIRRRLGRLQREGHVERRGIGRSNSVLWALASNERSNHG